MSANYIALDLKQRHASAIYAAAQALSIARGQLGQVKAIFDAARDVGAGSNEFLIPASMLGTTAADAQKVYDLVAGACTDFDADPTLNNLINWLGVTR